MDFMNSRNSLFASKGFSQAFSARPFCRLPASRTPIHLIMIRSCERTISLSSFELDTLSNAAVQCRMKWRMVASCSLTCSSPWSIIWTIFLRNHLARSSSSRLLPPRLDFASTLSAALSLLCVPPLSRSFQRSGHIRNLTPRPTL
jgi:hypothetical protein